ncbi:MAG: DUF559 domain-containing protein [Sphingomonas sp.]|nr:DUF559 domain-containing protein [Sphingomonas sp.]
MNWPNRKNTRLARDLRNNATDAERKLWQALSARKVGGTRFNRQVCIGPYICDFVARAPRLIIEVDGGQHADHARDAERTQFLLGQGYQVVRFWNHDVLDNIDGVVADIERVLSALPQPLPHAGGGPAAFGAEVSP